MTITIPQMSAKGSAMALTDLFETAVEDGLGGYLSKSQTGNNLLQGLSAYLGVNTTNVIYVATNGNDSTGTGTASLPYLTIGNAMVNATAQTASNNNITTISVAPGAYTETDINLKPGVNIVALGRVKLTISGTVQLDSTTWAVAGTTTRIFYQGIEWTGSGSINIDWSGVASTWFPYINLLNNLFVLAPTFNGKSSGSAVTLNSYNNYYALGCNFNNIGSVYSFGDKNDLTVTINSVAQTINTSARILGMNFGGNLTQNGTGAFSSTCLIAGSIASGKTFTSNGSNSTIQLDPSSVPTTATSTSSGVFSYLISQSYSGGTGNGFTKFTGATTSEKTYTLPNASDTIACRGQVNTFTKAQSVTPVAVTSSSNSIATDASLSNFFTHTFTENTTLANPTSLVAGTSYTWIFTQHASSAKTLALGNLFVPLGPAYQITTTLSAKSTLTAVYDGTSLLYTFAQA